MIDDADDENDAAADEDNNADDHGVLRLSGFQTLVCYNDAALTLPLRASTNGNSWCSAGTASSASSSS